MAMHVNQVLALTGFSYPFVQTFIGRQLVPVNWHAMSPNDRREAIEKRRLVFDREAVDAFVRYCCSEMLRSWEVLNAIKSMSSNLEDLNVSVMKIERFLFDFSEPMTLGEIAERLGYQVRSLRNKINTVMDGDQEVGLLDIPGFSFRLYKVKRQWQCSRFEFFRQVQQLGMAKQMLYFAGRVEQAHP